VGASRDRMLPVLRLNTTRKPVGRTYQLTAGINVQECQGMTVSMCLSCYYGDCVCKQTAESFDPTTGKWVDGR
jgi:hypothetical protein